MRLKSLFWENAVSVYTYEAAYDHTGSPMSNTVASDWMQML